MYKYVLSIAFMAAGISCTTNPTSDSSASTIKYPESRKDTTVHDNYFGTLVNDPYRWLENDTSVETTEWVKAQNKTTQDYLSKIPFRNALTKRYETLLDFEKYSAPFKEGPYLYYFKLSGLQNQSVLYRELPDAKEPELFLDPNSFSKDGTTSLAGINFSKDGSMVAYNISEGGSDWQKLVVMNANLKKPTGDTLELKFSGASWQGNDGFYYSTYAKPKEGNVLVAKNESHKLYYHKIGTSQKEDKLIFGNDEHPIRYVTGYLTEDEKWLVISSSIESYGNALSVKNLSKPNTPIVPVITDMKNTNSILDNDNQYFYLQTDRNAPTGELVAMPITNAAPKNWKILVKPKEEVLSATIAGGYFFCSYLKDALTKVFQYDKTGKQIREVSLPGLGTAEGFSAKRQEKKCYFTFSSYVSPVTIYGLDVLTGKADVFKRSKVQFNPDDYESKEVFYPSKDGTKIPMILTYKKGIQLNGKNPCLLYGYGGFSISITPYFSVSNIILLENGGIYAVPNIRGGGEYGEAWHQQGIKTKKQNVFDDFMAAATFLVNNKYTSRDLLAIEGGSNGGLLIGACITQQPGISKVAFPAVGVMDMLRYDKFTAGAGWSYDYGTAGDSKEMFQYLYHYSPLHNIRDTTYPATLITTADHDDRVVPAHSFKFAATMQEKQKGPNPVLISIQTNGGHGAGRSTQQIVQEQGDKWSFMFYNMGITPPYRLTP